MHLGRVSCKHSVMMGFRWANKLCSVLILCFHSTGQVEARRVWILSSSQRSDQGCMGSSWLIAAFRSASLRSGIAFIRIAVELLHLRRMCFSVPRAVFFPGVSMPHVCWRGRQKGQYLYL